MKDQDYSNYGLSANEGALLDRLMSAYLDGSLQQEDNADSAADTEASVPETPSPESPDDETRDAAHPEGNYDWLIGTDEDEQFIRQIQQRAAAATADDTKPGQDDQESDKYADPLHQTEGFRAIAPTRLVNSLARMGLTHCGEALACSPDSLPNVGAGSISKARANLEACAATTNVIEGIPSWLAKVVSVHESYGHYVWDPLGYLHAARTKQPPLQDEAPTAATSSHMPGLTGSLESDAERALSYFRMAHPSLDISHKHFFAWATFFAAQFGDSPHGSFYQFVIESVRKVAH